MGAWGVGLWSDDTASDVRGTYREALEDGLSDEEAKTRVLSEFALALRTEDASVVCLALAMSHRDLGRLDDEVRDTALAVIDSGEDLPRWEEAGLAKKRAAVLAKVRDMLVGPQPQRKKVRRPSRRKTTLSPGDVLGYQAPSGRYYLLAVRALRDNRYGTFPVVRLLEFEETALPDAVTLTDLRDRPAGRPAGPRQAAEPWWAVAGTVLHRRGHDYCDVGFTLVGRIRPPSQAEQEAMQESGAVAGWEFWRKYLDRQDDLLTEGTVKRS